MSMTSEQMDLDRIDAALAKGEPGAPVRRSFARMRTEDPALEPAPAISEKPTLRFPRPISTGQ
jgi:hypothetical protein